MSRLQTGTDWLIFLALCAFTTPIGGIIFYFCLNKPGLKMGQQLEFKHESTFSDLTPKTIRLTDVYENSMNVVVEVDRQVKVEYGQTYTIKVTEKIRDSYYSAKVLTVK